jgi:hypothetical protein
MLWTRAQLAVLSDMEADFLNAYDGTRMANAYVDTEHILQAASTAALLLTGRWIFGALSLLVVVYNRRERAHATAKLDTVTAFAELPGHKYRRIAKFGAYVVLFILSLYSLVRSIASKALAVVYTSTHHSAFAWAISPQHDRGKCLFVH